MNDVVVVAAKRTAVGKFGGAFNGVSAVDLGAAVMQNLLETTRVPREQIDEVVLGQVLTAGAGQNPARQSAIKAGLPVEVPAMTVNMVCGSSLKAIMLGAQAIKSGDCEYRDRGRTGEHEHVAARVAGIAQRLAHGRRQTDRQHDRGRPVGCV